ncbi:MAG: leucine-rich repeat domain-containing protein [Nostoc sp.]|uniref:leucine-rich repeat domain-containing protein n=1 Tax=Nostoc sp. TaxID=1180 RepID=UPI002FF52E9D
MCDRHISRRDVYDGLRLRTEIPDAIAKLTNLTQLDLSYNQITQIPEAIATYSKLTIMAYSILHLNEVDHLPHPNPPRMYWGGNQIFLVSPQYIGGIKGGN